MSSSSSSSCLSLVCLAALAAIAHGQRITTIQLDGVQYFISRMNPYSPELNYFLAYQYCRSIGLQLASFETKEKADSIMQYLSNAGYNKYDFWTSGNRLGTDMLIWMSTGLPFNATFDYMKPQQPEAADDPDHQLQQPVARQLSAVEQKAESGAHDGCVALSAPDLRWATHDCTRLKDFVCEQTRCYYYNYGSIPVSSAQGSKPKNNNPSPTFNQASTPAPAHTTTSPIITTAVYQENSNDYYTEQVSAEEVHNQDTRAEAPSEEIHTQPETTPDSPTETAMLDDYDTTETINIRGQKSQMLDSESEKTESESKIPESESRSFKSDYTSDAFGPTQKTLLNSLNNNNNENINNDVPWPWARNIMLEKPKKKNSN